MFVSCYSSPSVAEAQPEVIRREEYLASSVDVLHHHLCSLFFVACKVGDCAVEGLQNNSFGVLCTRSGVDASTLRDGPRHSQFYGLSFYTGGSEPVVVILGELPW